MPSAPILTLAAGSDSNSGFILGLLVILGAAALVSVFLRRLHLAAIPGYLIVGALIGASGVMNHLQGGTDAVREISELAIVLLMFTIGMHMDLESIKFGMLRIIVIGVLATFGATLIGWGAGLLFGLSAPTALVVAMGLAMSSTAVVLGTLNARREVHSIHGRLCVGIALVEDLIAVGVLALLPPIALWAAATHADPSAEPVPTAGADADSGGMPGWVYTTLIGLRAIAGIAVMIWAGRAFLPRILRETGRAGNTEGMLVVSAASALAAAVFTGFLGFGPALGAFLAGFVLSGTPFRHQLAGQLSPMRDLFLAVFFTSVGVGMDIGAAASNFWVIGIAVVVLIVVKGGVVAFMGWAGGASAPVAALTGLLVAQAGEFSLVVLQAALAQGIVPADMRSTLIALVVVSLILTTPLTDLLRPYLGRLARIKPAAWITNPSLREPGDSRPVTHHTPEHPAHSADAAPPALPAPTTDGAVPPPPRRPLIVVAGFGVVGRNIVEHLTAHGMDHILVDLNPDTVQRRCSLGHRAVFGDVSNPDVLESAAIHQADAVVLTIPDDDATLRACRTIREIRPDVFIAARTTYLSQAIAATDLGADHVTIEEVVTAQDMATKIIYAIGKWAAKPKTPHL